MVYVFFAVIALYWVLSEIIKDPESNAFMDISVHYLPAVETRIDVLIENEIKTGTWYPIQGNLGLFVNDDNKLISYHNTVSSLPIRYWRYTTKQLK